MEKEMVGPFIRRHRKAARLTQRELAEAIDMTDRRVSEWETGRGVPGRDAIDRMARLFHVDADEFFRRMRASDAIAEAAEEIAGLAAEERERRIQHITELTEKFLADPQKLDQWIDYGEWLRGRSENR